MMQHIHISRENCSFPFWGGWTHIHFAFETLVISFALVSKLSGPPIILAIDDKESCIADRAAVIRLSSPSWLNLETSVGDISTIRAVDLPMLVPRFSLNDHENAKAAIAVGEARQRIPRAKIFGDLGGLLNTDMMGKFSKAKLLT